MSSASVSCYICGSPEYNILFSYDGPDQYEKAVGITEEGYFRKWVRCTKCGLCYSVFSRSKETLDEIYLKLYRDGTSAWRHESAENLFNRIISLPEEESETKSRVKWIKEKMDSAWKSGLVKSKPPPLRFLDIGGGNGILAYEFRGDDWESYVMDPDRNGQFLQQKYGIKCLHKAYEPGSFGVPFDLISLVFVLEHLSSPEEMLNLVKQDMVRESFLYIEVPDAVSFKFKPSDDDIFNSCHLWMFDPLTLSMLLNRCGFSVLELHRLKIKRGHFAMMVLACLK